MCVDDILELFRRPKTTKKHIIDVLSQSNPKDEHLNLPVQPMLPKVLSRPEYKSQSNPSVTKCSQGFDKLSNPSIRGTTIRPKALSVSKDGQDGLDTLKELN